MDAVEAARQAAARLHDAAVAAGAEPWSSYLLAVDEAARRGIEVEKLPKGDARLRGGRALYDPGALTILHEDVGDAFIHAFLIAHELGHVEVEGRDRPWVTHGADPTRAAEAAPVGADRVVDYGRRQRREVQMDLFAREFLLPRHLARRLHVEDGMTAAQIAERLGAPYEAVAQQLLDALLLPPVPTKATAASPEAPLNLDQARAVGHRGGPYLLEAGPGTGKTQTLVGRVASLLESGIDASRILVMTFSNKAAGELVERIAAKRRDDAAVLTAGTFHAFGYDLVRRFHDRLGLPSDPRLIDRLEAIEILEDEFPRLGLKHFKNLVDPTFELDDILAAISRAKDEVVDHRRYRELAEAMLARATEDGARTAAKQCLEVATTYEAYERIKATRGGVDFGDLVSLPVHLCRCDSHFAAHLASLYDHVLVDEFQDVNRASVLLVEALAPGGKNLWAVGDGKQSIYRFRGASSHSMRRFGTDDFLGGERARLTVNYRSTAEITAAFDHFAADGMIAAAGADNRLYACRGASGVLPEHRAVGTADDEAAGLAEAIAEMHRAGIAYRDQVVLCTGNDRLAKHARALESAGIPVLYLGSLFEREEVRDLLALLSILIDRRAAGLMRVATMPDFQLDLGDVAAIISFLKGTACEPMGWPRLLDDVPGLTPAGKAAAGRIGELLAGFRFDAQPWRVLAEALLDRSRIAVNAASSTDPQGRLRGMAIWQLMNYLRVQPAGPGLPIRRLLDRIRRLVLISDERDLRQLPAAAQDMDAVRLMTIHGAKGLEFRCVHIPGMSAGTLPRPPGHIRGIAPPDGMVEGDAGDAIAARRAGHVEEQECLFFVALSRARDRLLLYSPLRASNGRTRPRSSFIGRLGATVSCVEAHPTLALPPPIEAAPVGVSFSGPIAITDHQLGVYERCPRRFLYTYVLDIGGRRTETAFTMMHLVVQAIVDWLASDPGADPTPAEVAARFDRAWEAQGPRDHGYAVEYRLMAAAMVDWLVLHRSGGRRLPAEDLRLEVSGGSVLMRPDLAIAAAGGTVIRRIRTGHRTSKEADGLAAAALAIAATRAGAVSVEMVHLGDQEVTPLKPMSPTVCTNRLASLVEAFGQMRAGVFPMKPERSCPRCPAFVICGPVPTGSVKKLFAA